MKLTEADILHDRFAEAFFNAGFTDLISEPRECLLDTEGRVIRKADYSSTAYRRFTFQSLNNFDALANIVIQRIDHAHNISGKPHLRCHCSVKCKVMERGPNGEWNIEVNSKLVFRD